MVPQITLFAHQPPPTDQTRQGVGLRLCAETARQNGLRIISIPYPCSEQQIRTIITNSHFQPGWALYSGPILTTNLYQCLVRSAANMGLSFLNSPEASIQITEFRRWYPLLADLTAPSVVIQQLSDCKTAAKLGFPVFIKGATKSNQEQGWEACLAYSTKELEEKFILLSPEARQRGDLVARKILALRRDGSERNGFPLAREYRCYLLDGELLGWNYYWQGDDPYGRLTTDEISNVTKLAQIASQRLAARLLVVDLGQLEDESWRVIEVGDAQHSAFAHIPQHRLWQDLQNKFLF